MATSTNPNPWQDAWNWPNTVTWARLVLSVVVFILLAFEQFTAALIVFTVAVGTDWLDGYLARALNQSTVLGRILDPWVDKVIIAGTFIYLATIPASGVFAAAAVIVVARELLVTALRSHLEAQSVDFSASWMGKAKMVLQSAACVGALLVLAADPAWLPTGTVLARDGLVWGAVVATILSGWDYVRAAVFGASGRPDPVRS